MTREEIKKMLPILVAFAEGKAIESRCVKGDKSLWYDDEDPSFDDDFEYRIKPEPKYRPFANAEECWREMLKHQPFGWIKDWNDNRDIIGSVSSDDMVFVCEDGTFDFDNMFKNYTFADGTPFGVKEE